jgi:hypothetical protein
MSDSQSGSKGGPRSGSKLDRASTDPQNPEAQALPVSGAMPNDAPRDRSLSDVVLYDEPMPPVQATSTPTSPASARAGSSATPGAPRPMTLPGASSTGSPSSSNASRNATPVPISWRVWPVVDSPAELLGLTAVLIVVPLVVWSLSGRTALTAICTIAVGAVVWRHFTATTFEINALGVTEKVFNRPRRIPWLSIDRYIVGRKGVFLTSAGAPLEVFRGLYLPWGSHRDQILSSLRYYLPNAEDVG